MLRGEFSCIWTRKTITSWNLSHYWHSIIEGSSMSYCLKDLDNNSLKYSTPIIIFVIANKAGLALDFQ